MRSEKWRNIPGLSHYQASSLGRVRSLDRHLVFSGRWGSMRRFHRGRVLRLRPRNNGSGQTYWSFYSDGGAYAQVNRAVAATFHGPPPSPSHEAAHLDGDTSNNRPENLAWSTPKENAAHKIAHGTDSCGSKNGASILRETDICPIFEAYVFGIEAGEIGGRYGVGSGAILNIISGRSWLRVDVGELRPAAAKRSQLNLERSWRTAAFRRGCHGPSLVAS